MSFVNYSPQVEQPIADETAILAHIEQVVIEMAQAATAKYGRAMHGTHAKAVGLLKGQLTVLDDLPSELRQGMFAEVGRQYEVVVRFSPGPPVPISDKASGQRGMSIKVLGVVGEHLTQSQEQTTQDWVLAVDKAFNAADARAFLKFFQFPAAKSPTIPEKVIVAGSQIARGLEAVLESVGLESPNLKFFGRPPRHPLSDSYYSQAAVRYGTYIAKLAAFPTAEMVDLIGEPALEVMEDETLRHVMNAYFADHEAQFDIRVQLCTDLVSMPVEDTSVEWPETQSPYRTVGRLVLPRQRAYSETKRAEFDERLSFNPAHALVEHQPLGSVMRARMQVYAATQRYRQTTNQVDELEPQHLSDLPD
ncbi:catalase family protein [Spirosoma sp.]|uniref:catalase family protein n=1 Tax=Spirosoma sp. TaxID=1899569 RepID=UPI00262C582B|nr:catalase family protein [Spirosoma sp.]MCX6215300.1 catalase family protein [Spirosoma sp.]